MPTVTCRSCHMVIASNSNTDKLEEATAKHAKATGHTDFMARWNTARQVYLRDGMVIVDGGWG
jgi:hypothetical protein